MAFNVLSIVPRILHSHWGFNFKVLVKAVVRVGVYELTSWGYHCLILGFWLGFHLVKLFIFRVPNGGFN